MCIFSSVVNFLRLSEFSDGLDLAQWFECHVFQICNSYIKHDLNGEEDEEIL